jgi:hypothetical protein
MGDLTPGAIEHFYPVLQVVALSVVVVVAIIGTTWGGFRWLRGQMGEVVSEAFLKWSAVYDQKIEDLRRKADDLNRRDEERAQSVQRLHIRVDDAWVELNRKINRDEVPR